MICEENCSNKMDEFFRLRTFELKKIRIKQPSPLFYRDFKPIIKK